MQFNNFVVLVFVTFVCFAVEGICFLKVFLECHFGTVQQSYNYFRNLVDLKSFLVDIRMFTVRQTHAIVEPEIEHNAEAWKTQNFNWTSSSLSNNPFTQIVLWTIFGDDSQTKNNFWKLGNNPFFSVLRFFCFVH